jgi:hypothetical protein
VPLRAEHLLEQFVNLLRLVAGMLGNLVDNHAEIVSVLLIASGMLQPLNCHLNTFTSRKSLKVLFKLDGLVKEELPFFYGSEKNWGHAASLSHAQEFRVAILETVDL